MNQLRQYQLDILDATRKAYRDGYRHPCIVAPCGAGKTVIIAEMARSATAKGNRVLTLVHRKELYGQTWNTFYEAGVNMSLCNVMMVQTAARRLDRLPEVALIITDENHHCPAKSYRRIYNHFEGTPTVGVTATPVRLNGGGLGDVNDILVEGVDTAWLIKNGYLAPYEYYAPTLLDTSGIRIKNGEYSNTDVAKALSERKIYGDVIRHYREYAGYGKAICYCASVEWSRHMADEFTKAGIDAVHIDAATPRDEREKVIQRFRDGDIRIICNVDLVSEGFDVPDCSVSILLRPTQSLALHIQQSMRCMRYRPGKRAVILDHVGNYLRHGMPDEKREWTLETEKRAKKNAASMVHIRTCENCYAVFPSQSRICPACGTAVAAAREVKEEKSARLERIEGFKLDFSSPDDCNSYLELLNYARRKGYKAGWAYYQARTRGYIA